MQDAAFGTLGVLRGPVAAVRGEAVELDAAGRIVVIGREDRGGRGVSRFSPAGVLDTGFAGGGRAPLALGIPGNARSLELQFAVARAADQYAILSQIWFARPGAARSIGDGFSVQAIDPGAPATVSSYVRRLPRAVYPNVNMTSLAMSADGTAAFVVGFTEVSRLHITPILLRVDLSRATLQPLPNPTAEWAGPPVTETELRLSVAAALRVRNTGPGGLTNADVDVYVSDDDVLDPDDTLAVSISSGAVRSGAAKTRRLTVTGYDSPGALVGKRLIAVVNPLGTLPELDGSDNVAVSAPIE